MKLILIALSLAFSSMAFADQCMIIPHAQAIKAAKQISKSRLVLFKCELCGDTARIKSVSSVVTKRLDNYFSTVVINGQDADLAYTFLNVGPGKYRNLSKIVKCPSSGVSEMIIFGNR